MAVIQSLWNRLKYYRHRQYIRYFSRYLESIKSITMFQGFPYGTMAKTEKYTQKMWAHK